VLCYVSTLIVCVDVYVEVSVMELMHSSQCLLQLFLKPMDTSTLCIVLLLVDVGALYTRVFLLLLLLLLLLLFIYE
jgi:hypothetical protein